MLPTLVRQAHKLQDPRITYITRTYPPRKVWPPDFSSLSRGEQFRLEKKYKRRVTLAMKRPRWNKAVRLAQFVSCTGVIIYGAFFMGNDKGEEEPFQGFRRAVFGFLGYDYPLPASAEAHAKPAA